MGTGSTLNRRARVRAPCAQITFFFLMGSPRCPVYPVTLNLEAPCRLPATMSES